MFRKRVDPRVAAIATLVTLLAIQGTYWRFLVYVPPPPAAAGGAGGGGVGPAEDSLLGLNSVHVENWIGDEPGYRDGRAWEARFAGPNALALLPNGELVVADSRNHCLRQVTAAGMVTTLAGGAFAGVGGNALGPASQAAFRYPSGVAAAADGTLYVSDTGNHRICRLSDGTVTLLAGGTAGNSDRAGAAARFNGPGPCAVDRAGVLWVLDVGNRKLRSITQAGVVTSPTTIPPEIQGILGDVLTPKAAHIWGSRDGKREPMTSRHRVKRTSAAAWVGDVRVYGDVDRHVLLVQPPGREPFLIAGRINPMEVSLGEQEGLGNRSNFATPAAVAARPDGTIYVADYDGNRIRRVRIPPALLQR